MITDKSRQKVIEAAHWSQLRSPDGNMLDHRAPLFPVERLAKSSYVLTGQNASGKTTQLNLLKAHGVEAVSEFMRDIFDTVAQETGGYQSARRFCDVVFQTGLSSHLHSTSLIEKNPDKVVVFDRGLGDFHGLLRVVAFITSPLISKTPFKLFVNDKDIRELLFNSDKSLIREIHSETSRQIRAIEEWSRIFRYRRILQLEALPEIETDDIRSRCSITTRIISAFINESWRRLGYRVEKIPPFTGYPERRADYILELIEKDRDPLQAFNKKVF